ncbi:MAG: outer membrane lipoprotein-sorting protein [bacterium]|nr:outer membrane lipoprotein-sorting protein [bacterium]
MNVLNHGALLAALLAASIGGALRAQDNKSGVPVPKLPEFDKSDAAVYGRQLADYADLYDTGWRDSYAVSNMTLFDSNGDSVQRRTVQLILEKPDGDKSIVRFLTPAEIKGVAALTHEHPDAVDDNWLYLPATKRVRRISGANKTASFQGTEFTYEDLSNRIVAKYDWRFLAEAEIDAAAGKVPVYSLEAKPRYTDTGYSRLVIHVHREYWRQERIEFYDKADRLLKVLDNSVWKHRHGRFWRPMKIAMKNEQAKKRTVIESSNQLLNLALYKNKRTGKPRPNLTDAQFTTDALTGRR